MEKERLNREEFESFMEDREYDPARAEAYRFYKDPDEGKIEGKAETAEGGAQTEAPAAAEPADAEKAQPEERKPEDTQGDAPGEATPDAQ